MAYTTVRTLTLQVADTSKVKGWGFLAQFVEYAQKKGTFTVNDLTKRFVGKQVPSKGGEVKKANTARIVRYAHWCVQQGIMAPVEV